METRIKSDVVLFICLLIFGAERYAFGTEPFAHWKFDEGSGPVAYDSAGINHGVIYGPNWTTGAIGDALDFDGTDDYVEVPDSNVLDITSEITLSAWIKPASTSGDHFVVAKWGVSNSKSSYGIRLEDATVRFFLVNGSSKTVKSYTDLLVSQNDWNYIGLAE